MAINRLLDNDLNTFSDVSTRREQIAPELGVFTQKSLPRIHPSKSGEAVDRAECIEGVYRMIVRTKRTQNRMQTA